MSTTHFWVFDIERGYVKLIDQPADRADKTHYLYKHHQNITRAATGQQRLTKFTYLNVWRAVNAGKFDPAEIKQAIFDAKNKLAQERGGTPVLSIAKKKRDANRALNHQQHLAKVEKTKQQTNALLPSFAIKPVAFVPTVQTVEFAQQCDLMPSTPSETISVASEESLESAESGLLRRPVQVPAVYDDIEDAMIMSRLEQSETLKIAQMKICKHIIIGGDKVCFPLTDLSMDIHLASNGVPTDPDLLYDRLENLAKRRGINFDPDTIYRDFKRAYGYVMFIPGKSSPECFKYIRY